MKECIIGTDMCGTNMKVGAFTTKGERLYVTGRKNIPIVTEEGHYYFNWEYQRDMLFEMLKEVIENGYKISSIGIGSCGEAVYPLDKDGKIIHNAIAWYVIEQYDRGFVYGASLNNLKYGWIFKTDINGNILWENRFGNGHYESSIRNIEQTSDGGFIFCGSTTKYSGANDAYIVKLNSCAEIEWCKTLITPNNYDMGLRVKPTPEGNYLLLGAYFLTNPVSNVSLFKFNSAGDLIWHQFYPFDSIYNEDQPADLLVDSDGYLVTSSRYYPNPGTTGPAVIRSYFIKTDTAGNKT